MRNSNVFCTFFCVLVQSLLYAQNPVGYRLNNELKEFIYKGLSKKTLREIDSVLNKIEYKGFSSLKFGEHSDWNIDKKLDKAEVVGRFKLLTQFDSNGVVVRKWYKKKCFLQKNTAHFAPFQLAHFEQDFYLSYSWSSYEKKRYIDGLKLPFQYNEYFLGSLIINDSVTKYHFIFSDIDIPEYRASDIPVQNFPSVTFANYQTIMVMNDTFEPVFLILRTKDFKKAHVLVIKNLNFYDSNLRLLWLDIKEYTLQGLIDSIEKKLNNGLGSKICDRKFYGKYSWSEWATRLRYDFDW